MSQDLKFSLGPNLWYTFSAALPLYGLGDSTHFLGEFWAEFCSV